ncbi:unnamed protein product [Hydatigera taeniaeformis]|uniref:Retrotransposon protein n=1 Tax=Hydatigena taeniaeformis TaxID=6205 RepID=A0A0R3X4V3_HYDTA|nr:unnamed protein product [Hydatigera taeniaeformis]
MRINKDENSAFELGAGWHIRIKKSLHFFASLTSQRPSICPLYAYAVDRGDHSFARHPDEEDQQDCDMGAEFSKHKHKCRKGKWVDKETWTGQNGEAWGPETNLKMVDKANQCVLQWIQSITAEEESTNLDDRPPKRPHSEICMRQFNRSLEALVGKIDLSCCDWLHRIGLWHLESKPHPAVDQSDEVKEASLEGSTPEISSLSAEREGDSEVEAAETASLSSLPDVGPVPEEINKLTEQEAEGNRERGDGTEQNEMVDILTTITDGEESRKMSHQASSIAKLKAAISEHPVKPKPKKRRPV